MEVIVAGRTTSFNRAPEPMTYANQLDDGADVAANGPIVEVGLIKYHNSLYFDNILNSNQSRNSHLLYRMQNILHDMVFPICINCTQISQLRCKDSVA